MEEKGGVRVDPVVAVLLTLTLSGSAFGIFWIFKSYFEAKKKQQEKCRELDRAVAFPPPLDECRATLVRKSCGTKMVGSKSSLECQCEYLLVFEDEFEREIPLLVEEEIYLAIEEGDSGILALSDGKLYSFTLDE